MAGITRGADDRPNQASEEGPAVYCVVPRRLARIQPLLCEHFAADANVEVVIDERVAERRRPEASPRTPTAELADRLAPGMERRVIDGRRIAVPLKERASLPPELRRYERELTFLAGPAWDPAADDDTSADEWRGRCAVAERQAIEVGQALIAATDALRSRRGLSPRRFRELARADAAIERFYHWCSGSERPGS